MIAIHTKYIPATNTKGARIKAYSCNGHKAIVSIDYSLGDVERHAVAVKKLIETQMAYVPDYSVMTYGGSADGKGYTFCFTQSTVQM